MCAVSTMGAEWRYGGEVMQFALGFLLGVVSMGGAMALIDWAMGFKRYP